MLEEQNDMSQWLTLERLEGNDLPVPKYATVHSAGLDFAACLTRPCKAVSIDAHDSQKLDFWVRPQDRGRSRPIGEIGRSVLPPHTVPGHQELVLYILPNETVMVPLGWKSSFQEVLHLQIHVRSSIGIRGIVLANGTGIVDADYRGELFACLRNTQSDPVAIKHGERIVQGILVQSCQAIVQEGSVDKTARGEGGYGSTGRSVEDIMAQQTGAV
jgi:deoxyuridine 5'-triphosphate nucleotidohydrolase